MIEMIIAMVLLALALGIAFSSVLQGITGSGSARSGAASDAAIERASARFMDDVAGAVTVDQRDGALRDPGEYEAVVQRNATATSSNPATPGTELDFDSVVEASPTRLDLRVEANIAAGIECVRWSVSTGAAYEVVRTVDPKGSCGSGSLGREVMVSAPAGVTGLNTTPFAYHVVCNGCPGGPATCKPQAVPSVPANRRRWIVAVSMAVTTVSSERGATTAAGTAKAAIRARDTESYRRALGC